MESNEQKHEAAKIGGLKPLVSWVSVGAILSLLLHGIIVWGDWFALSQPEGDAITALTSLLFVPTVIIVFLALPIAAIRLLFRSTRKQAWRWLAFCVSYIAVGMLVLPLAARLRMNAFRDLAQRSEPLVLAIHNYAEEQGAPPSSLESLAPEYEYVTGDAARHWEGNPWVLSVFTSQGSLNFDQFMYLPLQNYPQVNQLGCLERVGDWAYIHE